MAGGVGRGARASPQSAPSYISSAVALHLSARIAEDDASSSEALARFLSGGSGGAGGGDGGSAGRLFVWVPRPGAGDVAPGDGNDGGNDDDDEGWDVALASTDAPDGRNLGSLAFVNASLLTPGGGGSAAGEEIRSPRQIQCMVLGPRVYPDELPPDDAGEGGEGDDEAKVADGPADPGSATFLALQLYARHCFVPAVRAVEALEEEANSSSAATTAASAGGEGTGAGAAGKKSGLAALGGLEDRLRELDVALGQCRRGALGRIPVVRLAVHPDVMSASASLEGGKLDVDGSGLGARVDDDSFLNEVQAGVSRWIAQIRKVRQLSLVGALLNGGRPEFRIQ